MNKALVKKLTGFALAAILTTVHVSSGKASAQPTDAPHSVSASTFVSGDVRQMFETAGYVMDYIPDSDIEKLVKDDFSYGEKDLSAGNLRRMNQIIEESKGHYATLIDKRDGSLVTAKNRKGKKIPVAVRLPAYGALSFVNAKGIPFSSMDDLQYASLPKKVRNLIPFLEKMGLQVIQERNAEAKQPASPKQKLHSEHELKLAENLFERGFFTAPPGGDCWLSVYRFNGEPLKAKDTEGKIQDVMICMNPTDYGFSAQGTTFELKEIPIKNLPPDFMPIAFDMVRMHSEAVERPRAASSTSLTP